MSQYLYFDWCLFFKQQLFSQKIRLWQNGLEKYLTKMSVCVLVCEVSRDQKFCSKYNHQKTSRRANLPTQDLDKVSIPILSDDCWVTKMLLVFDKKHQANSIMNGSGHVEAIKSKLSVLNALLNAYVSFLCSYCFVVLDLLNNLVLRKITAICFVSIAWCYSSRRKLENWVFEIVHYLIAWHYCDKCMCPYHWNDWKFLSHLF